MIRSEKKKMDLGATAGVQSTGLFNGAVTTVTTIPILELREFDKRSLILPKTAGFLCAGCREPQLPGKVCGLNADIEEPGFFGIKRKFDIIYI